jgi:hypothetical protein
MKSRKVQPLEINCVGFIDRRSLDLHQRYDHIIEQRWRIAVSRNPKEIWRRKKPV